VFSTTLSDIDADFVALEKAFATLDIIVTRTYELRGPLPPEDLEDALARVYSTIVANSTPESIKIERGPPPKVPGATLCKTLPE
jgi:hypothetical protein